MFSLLKLRVVALTAVILVSALLTAGCSGNPDVSDPDVSDPDAFDFGSQSYQAGSQIYVVYSELWDFIWCLEGGSCGWSTEQQEAVRQNILSTHGVDFLNEIRIMQKRLWDLKEELSYSGSVFYDARGSNSSDKARFAHLKSQGSSLISLPYEDILDQVEIVVEQVRELGVGDAETGLITRALEGARLEILELIRLLDS